MSSCSIRMITAAAGCWRKTDMVDKNKFINIVLHEIGYKEYIHHEPQPVEEVTE